MNLNLGNINNLSDLLKYLRDGIYDNLKVATLAYYSKNYKSFSDKYSIEIVKPFPLEKDQNPYTIKVYNLSQDTSFQENDILLIIFCDKNFITNLNIKNDIQIEVEDDNRHNENFGIIVSKVSGGTATWGRITGNISDQQDLINRLTEKQNVLTPGLGIQITTNPETGETIISATIESGVIDVVMPNNTSIVDTQTSVATLPSYGISYDENEPNTNLVRTWICDEDEIEEDNGDNIFESPIQRSHVYD